VPENCDRKTSLASIRLTTHGHDSRELVVFGRRTTNIPIEAGAQLVAFNNALSTTERGSDWFGKRFALCEIASDKNLKFGDSK
jgi:hypothetical protein